MDNVMCYHNVYTGCHDVQNGGTMRHPNNCNQFIICLHGAAIVQDCGLGQHFSPSKGVCDFPATAGCAPAASGKISYSPLQQTTLSSITTTSLILLQVARFYLLR